MPGKLPSGRERGREELRIAAMGQVTLLALDDLTLHRFLRPRSPGVVLPIPALSLILLGPKQVPCPPSHPSAPRHSFRYLWLPALPKASGPFRSWDSIPDCVEGKEKGHSTLE